MYALQNVAIGFTNLLKLVATAWQSIRAACENDMHKEHSSRHTLISSEATIDFFTDRGVKPKLAVKADVLF